MPWTAVGALRGLPGPQGPQGPQGLQGVQGPVGEDGAGIEIAGSVAAYANLPTGLTAANSGEGYLVQADGRLYIWDGDSFPTNGQGVEFRGPVGPQGIQGVQGNTGPQGIQGVKGDTGNTGATGTRGTQWYYGVGAPPASITGSMPGDFYLDTDPAGTGAVYVL